MAKFDSPLTRVRLWLAKRLDPNPDPGEGWCINCWLADGKSVVISADAAQNHIEIHRETDGDHLVQLRTVRPLVPSDE